MEVYCGCRLINYPTTNEIKRFINSKTRANTIERLGLTGAIYHYIHTDDYLTMLACASNSRVLTLPDIFIYVKNISSMSQPVLLGPDTKEVKLNKNMHVLGDKAFVNKGLRNIELNEKLQMIGNTALARNDLTELVIPESVTYMAGLSLMDIFKGECEVNSKN